MVERFQQFSGYISGIYRQIQKIEREEMEKYGLKGAFAQYLVAMSAYPAGITATDLCEVCDKDKAAISRVVSEMEEKGLVQKIGENGRTYRAALVLTPKGREAVEYVAKCAREVVSRAVEGLSTEDRAAMYRSMELIYTNLQKI